MLQKVKKKALVLAAHTDDQIWCAGAIQKFSNDYDFEVICFTECGDPELTKETIRSCEVLGLAGVGVATFPVRHFDQYRQTILEEMIGHRKRLDPDMVFTHTSYDNHQDHKVIHEQTIRAFKNCTILGYEQPWNELRTDHRGVISITQEQLHKKVEAAKVYKTQEHRTYFQPHFIIAWAQMRGTQHGCAYAECYEVIKLRL